jgi:putative DNA primase/helicase
MTYSPDDDVDSGNSMSLPEAVIYLSDLEDKLEEDIGYAFLGRTIGALALVRWHDLASWARVKKVLKAQGVPMRELEKELEWFNPAHDKKLRERNSNSSTDYEDEDEDTDETNRQNDNDTAWRSLATLDPWAELPEVDARTLVRFKPNDDGNALAFKKVYGDYFCYVKAYGWMWWNGRHWASDLAESVLDNKVVEVMKRRAKAAIDLENEEVRKATVTNRSRINACIEGLKNKLEVLVEDFDCEPDLLNCNNGVVDLRTGELSPHSYEQKFTYCLEANYHPQADPSYWVNFLCGAVNKNEEVVNYLQLALGYTLTGHTREEILFYLQGPPRSGKGTITETLIELMGTPLSVGADFNTFTSRREGDASNFDLADLKPARAVWASESTRYQSLNAAKIKQLTGGDRVRCCKKHKDFFTYRPQYKIWLASNWEVNGDVDDDALWGRLRVIEFPNSHLGEEDKSIKETMLASEVQEGILAWMVAGAIAWYKLGSRGLPIPEAVKAATKRHRDEGDFVQTWLEQRGDATDPNVWTPFEELMADYKECCKLNSVEPKQGRGLSISLKAKGFLTGVAGRTGDRVQKGVQGLAIKR